jgi:hypothetical protein
VVTTKRLQYLHEGDCGDALDLGIAEVLIEVVLPPVLVEVAQKEGLVVVGVHYSDLAALEHRAVDLLDGQLGKLGAREPYEGVALRLARGRILHQPNLSMRQVK